MPLFFSLVIKYRLFPLFSLLPHFFLFFFLSLFFFPSLLSLLLHYSKMDTTFGEILDALSLSTLRYHWQTVLTSTVMFAIVYEISRIFSPVLFPKTFSFFKGVSRSVLDRSSSSSCRSSCNSPLKFSFLLA